MHHSVSFLIWRHLICRNQGRIQSALSFYNLIFRCAALVKNVLQIVTYMKNAHPQKYN